MRAILCIIGVLAMLPSAVEAQAVVVVGMKGYNDAGFTAITLNVEGVNFVGGQVYSSSIAIGDTIKVTLVAKKARCSASVWPDRGATVYPFNFVGDTLTIPTTPGQEIVFKNYDGNAPNPQQRQTVDIHGRIVHPIPGVPGATMQLNNWDGQRHGVALSLP